jgi:Fe-S cluster assembly protein SufD
VTATATRTTEPDWLKELRERGRSRFEELAVPHHKQKGWEFTDLSRFDPEAFPRVGGGALDTEPARPPVVEAAGHPSLRAVDDAIEVDGGTLPEGLTLTTLADAAGDHAEVVRAHLGELVLGGDKFAAQNTMAWHQGAFVHVAAGTRIEEPVVITAIQASAGAMPWRSLIVVEPGAEATVVEQYLSADDDLEGYFNPVTEIVVGEGASVNYLCVQDLSERSWILGSQRARVGRDASLHWIGLGLGSGQGKLRMETDITGQGASARVTGAYVGHGSQHLDYDTTQEHVAPHTTSDLAFRGILRDRATAVWSGMIKVDPGAQRTDAFQESRNLLLSDGAHADAIPGLEIEANDVRCTHGATAGRVDEEMIFYAQARGVDRETAIRLIVEGFFANVYDRITVEPVRETLRLAVAEKLELGGARPVALESADE